MCHRQRGAIARVGSGMPLDKEVIREVSTTLERTQHMKQVKRRKLALDKITIATLTSTELRSAVGGAWPETGPTRCVGKCESSSFC
jgi:hypothetical protein